MWAVEEGREELQGQKAPSRSPFFPSSLSQSLSKLLRRVGEKAFATWTQ